MSNSRLERTFWFFPSFDDSFCVSGFEDRAVTLDNTDPTPLYIQLKDLLQREITEGRYSERIPSERELMETYGVSWATARKAVSELVRDGFLRKVQGKGAFVIPRGSGGWVGSMLSFTETIEGMGMAPGNRLIWQGLRKDPNIAEILKVDEFYTVERLRLADDKPVALEKTHYPVEIGMILAGYNLTMVTIYNVLEANGIILYSAEQRITVEETIKADAKLLGIAPGGAAPVMERVTYDPRGRVIEHYRGVFRADRYTFLMRLQRKSSQTVQFA